MSYIITNVGQDWTADRATDQNFSHYLDIIAVGTGTTAPSLSDTSLTSQEYSGSKSNSNIEIKRTSNVGEIRCTISLTGGTEVPADTDVSEFGLVSSNGVLIYREVRDNAVTIASGDTKTFEFKITITE